jgi:hypothetical protein
MLTFTAPDQSPVRIEESQVIRARRTIYGENKLARCRIDWVQAQLVLEEIDDVAERIRASLDSFTYVTTKDGSKIWFDAKRASGPYDLVPSQTDGGIYKAAIRLMGYRQYVRETPAQVRDIFRAAGATPLP